MYRGGCAEDLVGLVSERPLEQTADLVGSGGEAFIEHQSMRTRSATIGHRPDWENAMNKKPTTTFAESTTNAAIAR